MRESVRILLELGRVPVMSDDDSYWRTFENALDSIPPPVSTEEATALAKLFSKSEEEDGFGLAWTLLHLIETAVSAPNFSETEVANGSWLRLISERRCRGRRLGHSD